MTSAVGEIAAPAERSNGMATQVTRRHFTVDDYERMGRAGILTEDDRVELIAGEIVEMSPIGSAHAASVNRLVRLLVSTIGDAALVSARNPIAIPPLSEPQPDLAVLRPRDDDYARGHPTPADVLLLVEVAESSLAYDRNVKLPLYAAAGVPEVWLVDLTNQRIERHSAPHEGAYRVVSQARRGESLTSATLPQLTIAVDAVLG